MDEMVTIPKDEYHHSGRGSILSATSLMRRIVPGSVPSGRSSRSKYPISAISTLVGLFATLSLTSQTKTNT